MKGFNEKFRKAFKRIEMNFSKEDPNVKIFVEDSKNGIQCCIEKSKSVTLEIFNQINHFDVEWRETTFNEDPLLSEMALAGLYIETRESVRCIRCCWCNKSIEILDGVEDLNKSVFHRKDCQMLSIEECKDVGMEERPKNFCEVEYAVTTQEIEARTETNPIYQLLDKSLSNASKEDIKLFIERRLKEAGKDFFFESCQMWYKTDQIPDPEDRQFRECHSRRVPMCCVSGQGGRGHLSAVRALEDVRGVIQCDGHVSCLWSDHREAREEDALQ